jgi:hypothetical protein
MRSSTSRRVPDSANARTGARFETEVRPVMIGRIYRKLPLGSQQEDARITAKGAPALPGCCHRPEQFALDQHAAQDVAQRPSVEARRKATRRLGSAGLLAEMGERHLRRRARDLHQPLERVGDVLDQENSAGDR